MKTEDELNIQQKNTIQSTDFSMMSQKDIENISVANIHNARRNFPESKNSLNKKTKGKNKNKDVSDLTVYDRNFGPITKLS